MFDNLKICFLILKTIIKKEWTLVQMVVDNVVANLIVSVLSIMSFMLVVRSG